MATESKSTPDKNDPSVPQARTIEYDWMSVATWQAMHAEDVKIASKGGVDLLMLGDSITQGWLATKVWSEKFGHYRSANFGIGGDATQNLLWRIENGDVGVLQPRLIVLLIGVNNLGREEHSPEETVAGISAILGRLEKAFPDARILLHAIHPSDVSPDSAFRRKITQTNVLLKPKADGKRIFFVDATRALLEADGRLSDEVSADHLHLTEVGYRRWTEVLAPEVARLMQ